MMATLKKKHPFHYNLDWLLSLVLSDPTRSVVYALVWLKVGSMRVPSAQCPSYQPNDTYRYFTFTMLADPSNYGAAIFAKTSLLEPEILHIRSVGVRQV